MLAVAETSTSAFLAKLPITQILSAWATKACAFSKSVEEAVLLKTILA